MRRVFLFWVRLVAAAVSVARGDDLSSKDLEAARKIYVAKCAKCHRFHDPKNYSDSAWQGWMGTMSRRSKLKPDEERLLTRYLEAYRAGEVAGKPQERSRTSLAGPADR
jgi:cytochrome c553